MDTLISEISKKLEAGASQPALYVQANFRARAEFLDSVEMEVDNRVESLLHKQGLSRDLERLMSAAERLKSRLEGINESLFNQLRQQIASGELTGSGLRQRLVEYAGADSSVGGQPDEGYDHLDELVNGLLLSETAPEAQSQHDADMFFYQPTPARIVLELMDGADLRPDDVFYDLGSGLGQVCILVRLLAGIRVVGVEVEPAYCDYARRCARGLNLSQLEFINADAREADYSEGSIFFMFTPFQGRMLKRVLEMLKQESRKRMIRVYAYGPCTAQVARESWLEQQDQSGNQANRLGSFRSR